MSRGGAGAVVELNGIGGRGGGGYTGGGGGGGTTAAGDIFGGGGGGGASYRHPTHASGAVRVTFQAAGSDSPPQIDLTLTPKDGTRLHGARARLTGSGLKPLSTYRLSTRGRHLGTGRTGSTGAFAWTLSLPARACVWGGLQELVLRATAPDDSVVTDSAWVVLGADCRVRETRAARPTGRVVVGDFLFGYRSARLTAAAERSLDRTASALTGAKVVTVTGYTQTQLTSEASRRANVALARQRAANVKKYLVARGVSARIVTVSRGPVDPVSTSKQQLNRRVEVSALY